MQNHMIWGVFQTHLQTHMKTQIEQKARMCRSSNSDKISLKASFLLKTPHTSGMCKEKAGNFFQV